MSAHLHIRRPLRSSAPSRRRARGATGARHLIPLIVALLAAVLLLLSRTAKGAEVAVSVNIAPPPLPVYEQPPLPAPGYLWIPGYWSYGPEGYFWVPGTWVLPPDPDLVWTPGYWEFSDNAYVWNPGYWGPVVGFYGGIVYGFGYFGHGYEGGYWRDHRFYYNSAVNNISNTNVTNVYSRTVNNVTVNNVSYSDGPGGVSARPTPQEQAASRQPRHAATSEQTAQVTGARNQRVLLASVNQGHPPVAATPKPNTFAGPGVVPARSAARAGNGSPPPSAGQGPAASQPSTSHTQRTPAAAEPQRSEPPRHLAQAPPSPPHEESQRKPEKQPPRHEPEASPR
jgi:hypothetical protein